MYFKIILKKCIKRYHLKTSTACDGLHRKFNILYILLPVIPRTTYIVYVNLLSLHFYVDIDIQFAFFHSYSNFFIKFVCCCC